jgi:hypothetical protein
MSTKVIQASDIQGDFFGGLPYNISWSFNNGSEPSRLSISVVSQNGKYSKPALGLETPQTVRIGSFEFEGYLIKYNFNNTPSQKILELDYVDKAIDLNKYFVGLHKKHGDKNTNQANNLILVGKEYHPCDKNLDSSIDFNDDTDIKQIDYCDPCPFMPIDKYDFSCSPVLKDFEIFEVYYTFNELISKIPTQFKTQIANIERFKFFKAQHVGSLKNVLDNWCSDLGLSYFWDPFDKVLKFVDRSAPITIPSKPSDLDIIDVSEGKSLENTFDRGFIGLFEKDGEIKSYSCEHESYETLKVLTVSDLYESVSSGLSNPEIPFRSDVKELIVAVSYLGEPTRNALIWFWGYGNLKAENVEDMVINDKVDKTKNQSKRGKIIEQFGNMSIKQVYHSKSTDQKNINIFNRLRALIPPVDLKRMREEDKKEGYNEKNPSYYFFVAEVDEELAQKQAEVDINLARNFLGKFWFKKINPASKLPVPGATNSNTELSIESPDGSPQWYRVDQDISALPIFNFNHEQKSPIGQIIEKLDEDISENDENEKINRDAAKNFEQTPETLRNLHSFILLERDAKWVPNEDYLQWYESLFQWYKDYSPQIFGGVEGRPEILETIYPEAANNSNIKLFIARELNDFEVKFNKNVQHPLEPKSRKLRKKDVQDVLGNTQVVLDKRWGLNGSKCVSIEIKANGGPLANGKKPDIVLYTPSQCFGNTRFIEGGNLDPDGDQGYTVFVKASTNFVKVLPKIQYVYKKDPTSKNVAKIDYHIKQITEDNLSVLKLNRNKCLIDKQAFEEYAENILQYSKFTMAKEQSTMTFKVAGLMPSVEYKASDGLSALQINVSDDGIFTTYSFEDLIVQPPSESYYEQYLKDLMTPKKSIGSLKPFGKNSNDYIKTAISHVQK